jgi:hypothetical protein
MEATQTSSAESGQKKYKFSRLLLPLLLYRAYLLLFVYLAVQLLPPIFATGTYYENVHWPPGEAPSLVTAYKTWDGHHYLYLSDRGYQPDTISNAFYPLWPLLIRLGSYLFLGNHLVSALVLSNLFSVAGLLLFHYFVRNHHGEEVADVATLLLVAYPGALFFAFPYTESLFFLLAVLFFLALYRRDYLAAALASFFLPLTRSVGVFVGAPFFYDMYRWWKERRKMQLSDLAYLIAPLLGMLTYFLLMYVSTGNPLEGMDAQKYFIGQRSLSKLFDLPALVRSFAQIKLWHGVLDSVFDRLWFVVLLLFLFKIWKMDRRYFWFSVLMGVFPVMTGTFWSFTRFLVVIFPVFIAAAEILSKEKWKGFRWTIIGILFSLQIVFLIRHINNYWAG